MADSIFRKLRDGGEEGELAPALTIEETVASPFALDVSCYLLANLSSSILAGKSKSEYILETLKFNLFLLHCRVFMKSSLLCRGLVLVTFSRSPSFYLQFLKQKGIFVSSSSKWWVWFDFLLDTLRVYWLVFWILKDSCFGLLHWSTRLDWSAFPWCYYWRFKFN